MKNQQYYKFELPARDKVGQEHILAWGPVGPVSTFYSRFGHPLSGTIAGFFPLNSDTHHSYVLHNSESGFAVACSNKE